MSEYYTSKAFIKSNSQYLNIKKCLQRGLCFSCSSNCECIFVFRSNNVLRSPGTSSRHCQSGGIRAHWNWALPSNSIFFFAFLGLEIEMGHSFDNFLSRHFPYEYSEIFSTNFYYALSLFLEQWMHKKKTSKFEREDKAMETHFYTMFFFTSFTRIFL